MGTTSHSFRIFKQAQGHFRTRYDRAWKIFNALFAAFLANPEQTSALFVYLGLVESLGNCIVDVIVMILIANGRDFHIERLHTTPRIKHATSIEDLEKERVALTTKLNFLRDNGIEELPSIIDSTLRNDIAHLNFNVKEDGIYIRGRPAQDVLSGSLDKLIKALSTTDGCLRQLEREKGLSPKKE